MTIRLGREEKLSPSKYDETIQAVPVVCQIRFLTPHPHRNHLDDHLDGKESKYKVIEAFKYLAPV